MPKVLATQLLPAPCPSCKHEGLYKVIVYHLVGGLFFGLAPVNPEKLWAVGESYTDVRDKLKKVLSVHKFSVCSCDLAKEWREQKGKVSVEEFLMQKGIVGASSPLLFE